MKVNIALDSHLADTQAAADELNDKMAAKAQEWMKQTSITS